MMMVACVQVGADLYLAPGLERAEGWPDVRKVVGGRSGVLFISTTRC